jgi:tetratricopeptide (TPR) repeat protein
MKLKGTDKDLRTIVKGLDVRYVLDGSVRKAGTSLRIAVQLIDGLSDANVWSEKYSGTMDDVFQMQESVSRSIVEALQLTLSTEERRQMEERPIANPKVYDLYLRSRAAFNQGDPAALDRSIALLKQGIEMIGDNELLYAALGYTHYFYFRWISKLDIDHLNLAEGYLRKTFAINPESSHGFVLQGLLSYSHGQIVEALTSLNKAVESDPAAYR